MRSCKGLLSFLFLVLFLQSAVAQEGNKDLEVRLKKHVGFLASDKLQGRLTGSKSETRASTYIASEFKNIGLKPLGNDGHWLQPFSFYTGYRYGKGNKMSLNGKALTLDKDFYPLAYSSNGSLSGKVQDAGFGVVSKEQGYNDFESHHIQKGSILLVDLSLPDGNSPHSKYIDYRDWQERVKASRAYKPAAILFYHPESPLTVEAYKKYNNLQQDSIPLLVVSDSLVEILKKKPESMVSFTVDLQRDKVEGNNVLGYLDNGAKDIVVIGAHYDHLGHGEFGNSLYTGKPDIHNGADDNASGTAVLIELARMIKAGGDKSKNYLFVAFSGEEEGLLGSHYLTQHLPLDASHISYMLNMDMVGRLDSTQRELGINGTGTSPAWDSAISLVKQPQLKIKETASGMGASDHTSFYLINIPVLHFFTGNHRDYHKPSDDADKINYAGMADVTQYIYNLNALVAARPKLAFQKTKEEKEEKINFKVTLGIMPDYFFDGKGIRVDGVSPGKSAEKAGLLQGDVIIKLGDYEVADMRSYMQALGKFNKGEETTVQVNRNGQILSMPVKF